MTKQGSVALSLGLMALIVVVVIVAMTLLKPPSRSKTTPSVEPTTTGSVDDGDRVQPTPRRSRPSLADEDGKYVDPSGAMGKASGNLAPPPPRPGTTGEGASARSGRRFTIRGMTTYRLRKQLGRVVSSCIDSVGPKRDAKAVVQLVVDVSVKSELAVIDGTRVSAKGVDADAVARCIRMGAAKVRVPAKDHDDVDAHTLTLPFRVRD